MHQLQGYKVDEKIYLGVRERKKLNITVLHDSAPYLMWAAALLYLYLRDSPPILLTVKNSDNVIAPRYIFHYLSWIR